MKKYFNFFAAGRGSPEIARSLAGPANLCAMPRELEVFVVRNFRHIAPDLIMGEEDGLSEEEIPMLLRQRSPQLRIGARHGWEAA
jgi:hypothetical protein